MNITWQEEKAKHHKYGTFNSSFHKLLYFIICKGSELMTLLSSGT